MTTEKATSGVDHEVGASAPNQPQVQEPSARDALLRLTAPQVAAGCWLCACGEVCMVYHWCMACGETVDSRLDPLRRAHYRALRCLPAEDDARE